jgi:hypothetical protein
MYAVTDLDTCWPDCAEALIVNTASSDRPPLPEPLPWRTQGMGDDTDDRRIIFQIADTNAQVKALGERWTESRVDAKNENERIWIELRSIKHDSNNREQFVSGSLDRGDRRMGEIERRVGEVELSVREIKQSVTEVQKSITDLAKVLTDVQKPLNELVELKKRFRWAGAALLSVIVFIGWFGKPIYEAVIARLFPTGAGH